MPDIVGLYKYALYITLFFGKDTKFFSALVFLKKDVL